MILYASLEKMSCQSIQETDTSQVWQIGKSNSNRRRQSAAEVHLLFQSHELPHVLHSKVALRWQHANHCGRPPGATTAPKCHPTCASNLASWPSPLESWTPLDFWLRSSQDLLIGGSLANFLRWKFLGNPQRKSLYNDSWTFIFWGMILL